MFHRVAQDPIFRNHHQRDDRDKQQGNNARDAQAKTLLLADCVQLLITFAFPFSEARFDDFISN
ncbi:hypothetical protein D3C80_1945230 [compost metagenome]